MQLVSNKKAGLISICLGGRCFQRAVGPAIHGEEWGYYEKVDYYNCYSFIFFRCIPFIKKYFNAPGCA